MRRSLVPLFLVSLAACAVVHEEDTVVVAESFDEVRVQIDHGSVEIVAVADGEPVRVDRHVTTSSWNQASSRVEVRDGALRVTASCGGPPETCAADHRLFVPASVSALVVLGSGEIVVTGLEGEVAAETGAGDVEVSGAHGAVEVETFAGTVLLHDLAGPVRASTDAGEVIGTRLASTEVIAWSAAGAVDLELIGAIAALDARTGAGDIDLRVPAGSYALDLTAQAGDLVVEGVSDRSDGAPIHAHSSAGDVRVHGE